MFETKFGTISDHRFQKEATAELFQWFIMALSAMGKSEWAAPPIYNDI
jgi:hypothetical protein